jgi:hypothetical protein
MRKRTAALAAGLGAAAAMGVGGVAVASGGDDGATVSGPQAARATSAALDVTHGGRVNSVERDTENGATWEVEITEVDGHTVDVRLDAEYDLVVVETDSDAG